jgi:hypothetical protein
MMVQFLIALVCIVLGFISALFQVDVIDKLAPLEWFVAAIAVNTLTVVMPKRKA